MVKIKNYVAVNIIDKMHFLIEDSTLDNQSFLI